MRYFLKIIGSAVLAATLLCAASGAARAQRIHYGGQTAQDVTVFFNDMPAASQLLFVNWINGVKTPALVLPAPGGGSTTLSFATLPSEPGEYYVLAISGNQWLSQTVVFYVHP